MSGLSRSSKPYILLQTEPLMRAATAARSRTSSWSDPGMICASMISSACAPSSLARMPFDTKRPASGLVQCEHQAGSVPGKVVHNADMSASWHKLPDSEACAGQCASYRWTVAFCIYVVLHLSMLQCIVQWLILNHPAYAWAQVML